MNINSQHIQHDKIGNTWNYTEQKHSLAIECHTILRCARKRWIGLDLGAYWKKLCKV